VTLDGSSKNRILLIAYHFPPSAAVGGMRMANFAKWLPSFGWEPYVLTIRDENIEQLDRERLRDVDGVIIHKVGVRPTVATMYAAIKTRLYGSPRDVSRSETGPSRPSGSNAIFFPSSCFPTMSEVGSSPRSWQPSAGSGGIESNGS
jgi:hypothetical protein